METTDMESMDIEKKTEASPLKTVSAATAAALAAAAAMDAPPATAPIAKSESKPDSKPEMAVASATAKPAASVPQGPPVLGTYTDFRQYLKDVYEYRRRTESTGLRAYSYSAFSAAADIKSPNYLKLIIEGRRNLSDDMITRFARALRLQKAEAEEFRALVHYGQETEPIQRNQYLKELADLRARRSFASGEISQEAFDKVPGWMGWVLFAMVEQYGVSFDPDELYRVMRAKTSPEDIKGELKKLIESGGLREEGGRLLKGRDLIESPQDLPVEVIRKLQAELIYLGIESLFKDSPKEREFGAMTIAMTQAEFEQVRFELRQLRKRIQKDLMVKRETTKGERVYQMNIQLFPVTDRVEGGQA